MQRQLLLVMCLVATWTCSAAGADLKRIEPVAPEAPVPAKTQREFDRRYGEAFKAAMDSEAVEDDDALVERLVADASRLQSDPTLLAYVLDQTIRLAGVCPGRQKLTYDTLKRQATDSLRPALPCYETMMRLVPRVADQLGDEQFAAWFAATCAEDARRFAALADAEEQHLRGMAALAVVLTAAEARFIDTKDSVADDLRGLEFLKRLVETRRQYEKDIASPSADQRKARVFLGIVTLARDGDLDTALGHLTASGDPKAAKLAGRLTAFKSGESNLENAYEMAEATVELADSLSDRYLQLLLYKEAEGKLAACLADPGLVRSRGAEARSLQKRAASGSALAMGTLPALVRDQVQGVRQKASRDTEYVQTFFGVPIKSNSRIVFVIDRSGSMTDSMAHCKWELARAIASLTEDQSFQVMFYSSGPAVVMGDGEMALALDVNKKAAIEFIKSIAPIGQTDPSDALTRAFQLKPDTIYLLTDGEFEPSVMDLLLTLNSGLKVTVHTICFIYSNGERLLQEIARTHKGTYRFVGENDLKGKDLEEFATPKSTGKTPPPPAQVTLRKPIPEGKPMPQSKQQKLERLVTYLRQNRGKAKPAALAPSVQLVEEMLDEHGKHVPQKLRDSAQRILDDLKRDAAR